MKIGHNLKITPGIFELQMKRKKGIFLVIFKFTLDILEKLMESLKCFLIVVFLSSLVGGAIVY